MSKSTRNTDLDRLAALFGCRRKRRFLIFRESDSSFRQRLEFMLYHMPVGTMAWAQKCMEEAE